MIFISTGGWYCRRIDALLIILCTNFIVVAQKPIISKPIIAYTREKINDFIKSDSKYHSAGRFVYDVSLNPILKPDGQIQCLLTTPLSGHDYYMGNLSDNSFLNQHIRSINDIDIWPDTTMNYCYTSLSNIITNVIMLPWVKNGLGWLSTKTCSSNSVPKWHPNFNDYTPPFNGEVAYIANLYIISDTLWIGFVHVERSNKPLFADGKIVPRNYAIGIAASFNQGINWKYYGDVIRPHYDPNPPNTLNNIMGAPFIIIEESGEQYFYVYFTEWVKDEAIRVSVAKERVTNVLSMIKNNTDAQPWSKYNNNVANHWNENGFTGIGVDIMHDLMYPSSGDYNYQYSMHTDAVHIISNNTYAMFPSYCKAKKNGTDVEERGIVYLQSQNGLNWHVVDIIDKCPDSSNEDFNYAAVFPMDSKKGIDGTIVNDRFSIIYPKMPILNRALIIDNPEVRKVNVNVPSNIPVLNLLLGD